MTCRICGAEARLWGDRGDVALYRCLRCRFISGRPAREQPADERYENYYHGAPPAAPSARYQEWLARAEAVVGRGRLLEIGAGSGGFVRVALARGWVVDAIEVSRTGIDALRATGTNVFAGDVTAAGYLPETFDLVVSLEVLEHLPAPLTHLRELQRITRPGGLLLLSTPNFDGLTRRLLGLWWRVVDPEHHGYFTLKSLKRALREAGYSRVTVTSRSLDITSWRRARDGKPVSFDPQTSARLRDAVDSSRLLRAAKVAANILLGLTGLGDTLLTWARR